MKQEMKTKTIVNIVINIGRKNSRNNFTSKMKIFLNVFRFFWLKKTFIANVDVDFIYFFNQPKNVSFRLAIPVIKF